MIGSRVIPNEIGEGSGTYGSALFYPSISVQSSGWLAATLLFWDSVRRIVPANYPVADSDSIKRFVGEGLLVATPPDPYVAAAETTFLGTLDRHDSLNQSLREAVRNDPGLRTMEPLALHPDKMTGEVLNRLREQWSIGVDNPDWMVPEPAIARLYMSCLATCMSAAIDAPLVTDDRPHLGWSHLFTHRRGVTSDPVLPVLAQLQLDWPDAAQLERMPPAKFIEFHRTSADERRAFRAEMLRIRADLARITDLNMLADAVESHRKAAETAIGALRKTHKRLAVNDAKSAFELGSSLVKVVAGVATGETSVSSGLTEGANLLISGAAWSTSSEQSKAEARASTPYSYSLIVKDTFGA